MIKNYQWKSTIILKVLNYRYKEKISSLHKQKKKCELDEVLDVEFDARKKVD